MMYFELPTYIKQIIACSLFVIAIVSIFGIVRVMRLRVPIYKKMICCLEFIFIYITFQLICDNFFALQPQKEMNSLGMWFERIPSILIFGELLLFWVILVWEYRFIQVWQDNHITRTSIIEGFNELPTGICFFDEDGLSLLVNNRMDELCFQLTGKTLLDVNVFWEHLKSGDVLEKNQLINQGEKYRIYQLEDGSIWNFEHQELQTTRGLVHQITAADITYLYLQNRCLESDNKKLAIMNQKLKEYDQEVMQVVREQEIFYMKIKVHNEMGEALLSAKRYLKGPDNNEDAEKLLGFWKKNILLKKDASGSGGEQNDYKRIEQAAEEIGINIITKGIMPVEKSVASNILVQAVHTCILNTVRHAEGTEQYVEIKREENKYIFILSNNGRKTHGTIHEGGGLKALRNQIERNHGSMRVISVPDYKVMIELPIEKEDVYE